MLRQTLALTSLFALAFAASAQAQSAAPTSTAAPTAAPSANGDPWEGLNRDLYLVGGALDVVIIRPVAVFYKHVTPRPAREGVHNVVTNLGEPLSFVNQALQLRPKRAVVTAGRFVMNSTVGVAGVFDVATGAGLKEQDANFGQTLGRYGVGSGPYVFLPILGPSSVRDATGRVIDIFLDPINYLKFRDDGYFFMARSVVGGVDARVIADPTLRYIQKTATDPYVALRSAYQQNAVFLDKGGKVDVKALPDFGPEPGAARPTSPTPQ